MPRGAWVALAACLLLYAIAALDELRHPLNPDVAWLLYSGERLLRGERLYVDILEINPPLIVWLNAPVAALSRILGIHGPTAFRIVMMALVGTSSWMWGSLAGRLGNGLAPTRRWVAILAASFVLLPLAAGMFGQREHLAFTLILPFLGLSGLRMRNVEVPRAQAIVIGLMGAVGMAIKPHYGAVWLALVAVRWWAGRPRGWRPAPEDMVVLAAGVLYPLGVWMLTPGYFAFAAGVAHDYLAYGAHPLGYILFGDSPAWWFYVALAAWLVMGERPDRDPTSAVVAAAGLGFLLAIAVQYKGWSYHYYPLNACAFLLALSTLTHPRPMRKWPLAGQVGLGIYAVIVALFVIAQMASRFQRAAGPLDAREAREVETCRAVMRQSGARSILVLSSQLRDAFPLVNDTRLRWTGGYPNMWFTLVSYGDIGPGMELRYHSPDQMAPAERAIFNRVIHDFADGAPDVLVVESPDLNERRIGVPGGFDYLRYFSQDSRFAAALAAYGQEADVDGLRVLRRRAVLPGR